MAAMRKMRKALDRLASSVVHQVLLWMFLWVFYALWAGYSPLHPGTTHSEPHFALVIAGFMVFLFLCGDQRELKLLVINSAVGFMLVLTLLLLNGYRLLAGHFPESWMNANPFVSVLPFLLLQIIFLGIMVWHISYTVSFWRRSPPAWSRRERIGCVVLLLVIMGVVSLAVFFMTFGSMK